MRTTFIQGLLLLVCTILMTCLPKISGDVDQREKDLILKIHNDARRNLMNCHYYGQPGAQNLSMLTWDDDLAAKAKNWSVKCIIGHDTPSNRALKKFPSVGQNLAVGPWLKMDVIWWLKEQQRYDFKHHKCYGRMCTHYTQAVSRHTTKIGCDIKRDCPGDDRLVRVICDYGPGGNYAGERPYYPKNCTTDF